MPPSEVMHATRLVAVWRCIRDGAEEHAESLETEVILLETRVEAVRDRTDALSMRFIIGW